MATFILLTSFFVFLFINVPIAVCLGLSSLLTLSFMGMNYTIVPINYYAASHKFVLLAIPFFILAGNIMEKAEISTKLIDLARATVGHLKGGLAIMCVGVACFFAAISGSGPATVAALGMIIIPAMVNVGYRPASASALMATAGAIGVIIPPSISFVVYGSITGTSISKMFMGGILPGLLMGACLVAAMFFAARKDQLITLPKTSAAERWKAFKTAVWGLLMPIIILGGIYGGIFTPTEAAAVAAVYGLFVGIFVYKTVGVKQLYDIFVVSASQTAVVMFIVCAASLFSYVITVGGIASAAGSALTAMSAGNSVIFLLIVNIILLIAGCFIDGTSAFYIFTPIMYPVALALGIDPIAFGVMMTMNLAIGQVTPPVGINLYVACPLGGVDIKSIAKAVVPFIVASVIALLMITYIPGIVTILPNMLK